MTQRKHVKQPVSAILLALTCITAFAGGALARDKDEIPDYLFIGKKVPNKIPMPPAPPPDKNKLVPPPGENSYFPVREDGQPYILNIDRTVNLTEAMNRTYYNPKWRGEDWTPFDQVDNIERASRLMGTWKEYDEANIYRVLTPVNKFLEKYSGFGP
ncbi:MAG TPA: hypothetical protein V6C86_20715 [Oculatellaceae cyanobacterium]